MPRDEGEWIVEVDASSKSVGAVCSQVQDGKIRVIEYASRILTKTEENYCVTRKEMLAIIFALKHFRCYLTGLPNFRLVTDHKSLEFFDRSKEPDIWNFCPTSTLSWSTAQGGNIPTPTVSAK